MCSLGPEDERGQNPPSFLAQVARDPLAMGLAAMVGIACTITYDATQGSLWAAIAMHFALVGQELESEGFPGALFRGRAWETMGMDTTARCQLCHSSSFSCATLITPASAVA